MCNFAKLMCLSQLMIDTTVFQNKTAVYYTLGCKLNFSETSTIGKILREAGVRTARKGEKADICVVNCLLYTSRIMTKSDFSEAGPMNEMVAMGVLAIRLQALNKTLEWDGANMCFTNIGDNETIRTVIKDGFKIHDGHPTFDKTWTDPINAKQFAAELVKHT